MLGVNGNSSDIVLAVIVFCICFTFKKGVCEGLISVLLRSGLTLLTCANRNLLLCVLIFEQHRHHTNFMLQKGREV